MRVITAYTTLGHEKRTKYKYSQCGRSCTVWKKLKGMGNKFNELITEKLPTPCNDIAIHVQEAF